MNHPLSTIFVMPAHNSASRLGAERFCRNLHQVQRELARLDKPGTLLVVENSTVSDRGMTAAIARQEKAETISLPPISSGYARFHGLDHALHQLKADVAIMGDDDLHVEPAAITQLVDAIGNGADLVLGVRGPKDFATHPIWQIGLEQALNIYCTVKLNLWPLTTLGHYALFTDFVSGGQAFSRQGWERFRMMMGEAEVKKLGPAATFFPGVFHRLGLPIKGIKISAPYEGRYWQDTFNLGEISKRLKMIRRDMDDCQRALTLPINLPIK
jgi:hypothetical protein